MSISDKFLGIFRVKDEDYDDDDYYDDYEDEYDDIPAPKKSVRKKPKKKAVPDDLDEIDEDYEDELDDEPVVKKNTAKKRTRSSKIVPMNSRSTAEVCVIKPESVEDANEVSDTLLQGKAVILNLSGIDVMVSQRIIDFSGGTCYAIGGNLKKVRDDIFVISPPSIDISGDIQELPNGDFDMSSITAKKLY